MKREMMKLEDILGKLKTVYDKFDNIKVGVAGSYARGTQKRLSDIDVVLDGDSTRIEIAEYIEGMFNIPVDIIWKDLLREDDEELDALALRLGLEINDESAYKTIMRDVIWVWVDAKLSFIPSNFRDWAKDTVLYET